MSTTAAVVSSGLPLSKIGQSGQPGRKYQAYFIRCTESPKIYVGITVNTLDRRFASHKSNARSGSDIALYKAMRKYGIDKFYIELASTTESWEELLELEKALIAKLGSLCSAGGGWNVTGGGEGVFLLRHSTETRAKMSASKKGRRGTPHSPEARLKMSASAMGKKISPQTRAKIAAAALGRIVSTETRAKIGAANKGKPGQVYSIEDRERMAAGWGVFPETREIVLSMYNSGISKAIIAKELNFSKATIAKMLRSKGVTYERLTKRVAGDAVRM
jgi:group I intron endonuclease